ncbi:MAG: hypothetical protein ACRDOG_16110 [Gaiellaceae bacterium]
MIMRPVWLSILLRAREPSAFLERHPIAFRFRDAEVLDRIPPKVEIALTHSDYATVKVRALLLAERSTTRSPPGERQNSTLSKP